MRTTLELDDDLVCAAKQLAGQEGVSLGRLISELARQSLLAKGSPKLRHGIPLFAAKAGVPKPDLRMVNQLRD